MKQVCPQNDLTKPVYGDLGRMFFEESPKKLESL